VCADSFWKQTKQYNLFYEAKPMNVNVAAMAWSENLIKAPSISDPAHVKPRRKL